MSTVKLSHSLPTVLVVDDDPAMRLALAESLKQLGYAAQTASSGEEALSWLGEKPSGSIQAILTDMKMAGMNGLDLFHHLKSNQTRIPVIIMTAYGTIDTAVTAIRSGVVDYLVKPFSQDKLREVLRGSLSEAVFPERDQEDLEACSIRKGCGGEIPRVILAEDPAMLKLLKLAQVVAASDATILIEGESGTGKELLARFIHEHSLRAHRPFIAINCAAVPENLLESELFGYEKGAFTGAMTRKPGRFELAHTGTLFLDELSEMPLHLQAKLLRVLQERELDRVGGREPIPLSIRVIATTNRALAKEVEAGHFREDLYYRINVFPLRIPLLRERRSDIPLLAGHFIEKAVRRNNKAPVTLSQEARNLLLAREWRGNVRELENILERAVLLADQGTILPEHLLLMTEEAPKDPPPNGTLGAEKGGGRPTTLWEAERNLILETLEKIGGNRTHAAKRLGISIRTLRNKLREYRLSPLGEEDEKEGEG